VVVVVAIGLLVLSGATRNSRSPAEKAAAAGACAPSIIGQGVSCQCVTEQLAARGYGSVYPISALVDGLKAEQAAGEPGAFTSVVRQAAAACRA
jgi:hypothetical protein